MEDINKDVEKIYEFVCQQHEVLEKAYDKTKEPILLSQASGFWAVKNMIEVNFTED